jgi:hypothetical protein
MDIAERFQCFGADAIDARVVIHEFSEILFCCTECAVVRVLRHRFGARGSFREAKLNPSAILRAAEVVDDFLIFLVCLLVGAFAVEALRFGKARVQRGGRG